jgi:hypothetical protein
MGEGTTADKPGVQKPLFLIPVYTARPWFSLGTPVSSTNNIYLHDIAEILLKVASNIITPIPVNKR